MESDSLKRLPREHLEVLKKGGFHSSTDVLRSSPQRLSQKCKISLRDADRIIDLLYDLADAPEIHVLEDLKIEANELCTTGDGGLDEALGGGLRPGMVWEVVGESAAGKTQFALQLALAVQLPKAKKGLDGSACYLTTSSHLPTNRLEQISRLHPYLAGSKCGLQNVHTIAARTIPMLIHVLTDLLPQFICQQSNKPGQKPVKLVVIDALAELFHSSDKTTTETLVERSEGINSISQLLHTLASKRKIIVLVLNEVVDVFNLSDSLPVDNEIVYREQARWFGRAHSLPAESTKEASLGLAWANHVNVRIFLSRTGRRRYLNDSEYPPIKRSKPQSSSGRGPLSTTTAAADEVMLIRRLSVVFSSVSRPVSLDYIVTEAGISVLPGVISTLGEDGNSPPPQVPFNADQPEVGVENASGLPCSQIAPLDVGISESNLAALAEEVRAEDEDEWDRYWASDEIPPEMYLNVNLEGQNPEPA